MPVLANIEVIWVIIILGSVIAQIIKGAKKMSSQAPRKPSGADKGGSSQPEYVAPDEALQEFLQSLGGGEKPRAKAAKASPVQAKSVRRGLSQAQAPVKRQPRSKRISRAEPQVAPLTVPVAAYAKTPDKVQQAVKLEKFVKRETAASVMGDEIRKDLADENAIRKAIVLREILGPPVALRQ